MLKIFITSLICTLMLFCTNVSAADFQAGDTAYVKAGIESMSVYQNPSYGRSHGWSVCLWTAHQSRAGQVPAGMWQADPFLLHLKYLPQSQNGSL